jgi:uncharacterized membrane protein
VGLALLGGAIVTAGLRRRSPGGMVTALAGGGLLYRGLSGRSRSSGVPEVNADGQSPAPPGAAELQATITIGKSPDELHRLWREPRTLPQIVGHMAEVRVSADDQAHWSVRGPAGRRLEWQTRVVEERPGEVVRWESLPGAPVPNGGAVRFRPGPAGEGTETTLLMHFDPPGGRLGVAAATALGTRLGLPLRNALLRKVLRRFKSLAETGEIPTLERNPAARGDGRDRRPSTIGI